MESEGVLGTHQLLSERGEASQTALAQEITNTYGALDSRQQLGFFKMLCREFSSGEAVIRRAAADYRTNLQFLESFIVA